MLKKQKFVFEYELDKPVCDGCGKDFAETEPRTENITGSYYNRTAPNHEWEVEEQIYLDGEKLHYHSKCLKAALKITTKPKRT